MTQQADVLELQPIVAPQTGAVAEQPAQGGALSVFNPAQLLQIAVSQNADMAKLEKLLDLRDRWEANEARKAFDEALAGFKGEAVRVIKRRTVDFTGEKGRVHYKHANLFDVVEAVAPALSTWGFSWNWSIQQDRDWITVTCHLKHKLGHSETATMGGPIDKSGSKNTIQGIASTTSYLQRHTLKAVTGVAEADEGSDDGREAGSGDPLDAVVDRLLQQAWRTNTDEEARKFWLDHRAETGAPNTATYIRFKNEIAKHREGLAKEGAAA